MLKIGDKAPDIELPDDKGNFFKLSDLKGRKIVLYFYPKDNTSGCTKEACGFRDSIEIFSKNKTVVIGVSKDNPESHRKFKDKFSLPFTLLSDENQKVLSKYGVWKEKSMYGRKYMGIERTTFLIDEKGIIRNIWNKVKVPGHVEEIITKL
ncbi:MAG: thioredoxin-dependent thiol peroxidase [Ignavibacteria bacterium]|jgi:peroxiredoxin Q/BCP|nr:thioredoxin-dependent thiol peroxidase [Ignavibacteria bacterium]